MWPQTNPSTKVVGFENCDSPRAESRQSKEHSTLSKSSKHNNSTKKISKKVFKSIFAVQKPSQSQESAIKTTIHKMVIYVIFLTTLLIVTFSSVSTMHFHYTQALQKLFVESELKPGVSWTNMLSVDDVVDFINGPFVDGIYWPLWTEKNNNTIGNVNHIFYENVVITQPAIRQLKVKQSKCEIDYSDSMNSVDICYPNFDKSLENMENISINDSFYPDKNFYKHFDWQHHATTNLR